MTIDNKLKAELRKSFKELSGRKRIKYPTFDRPFVIIDGKKHDVLDLSASGVKCKAAHGFEPKLRQDMMVEVFLVNGKSHKTLAQAVRRVGDLFILAFRKHLSEKLLLAEVDALIEKYGDIKFKN